MKNKFIANLVAILMALVAMSNAYGATEVVDGITWTYTVSDGKATVGGNLDEVAPAVPVSTSGAIIVPSKLGGYPVVGIGDYAFYKCDLLTSVTIPDTVTTIGESAFLCLSIESVVIPDSVRSIGADAFQCCRSLKSIRIPSGITRIASGTFCGCDSLESVTIPDGVTYIGGSAFSVCASLANLTIPNSVTNIGHFAFESCGSLESVTIPSSVTYIDEAAFMSCRSLKSVILPNNIASINNYVFGGCYSLESVSIPNSVTNIGDNAFECCSSLESVTIPNSVTYIGSEAFAYCDSLLKIEFLGNAPKCEGSFKYVRPLCTVYVKRGSTGWGVDIPGAWNGITINYFEGDDLAFVEIPIPSAVSNLVYTGSNQVGVIEGEGYTLIGNTATEAGTYQAYAKLEEGYKWADGTDERKFITYSIAKATNEWTTLPSISLQEWTVGETPGVVTQPVAKFGTITIEIGELVDGEMLFYPIESFILPTEPNIYRIRYSVEGTNNYTGLERIDIVFEISKQKKEVVIDAESSGLLPLTVKAGETVRFSYDLGAIDECWWGYGQGCPYSAGVVKSADDGILYEEWEELKVDEVPYIGFFDWEVPLNASGVYYVGMIPIGFLYEGWWDKYMICGFEVTVIPSDATTYYLEIVQPTRGGAILGAESGPQPINAELTLTRKVDEGYHAVGWRGDIMDLYQNGDSLEVIMDKPRKIWLAIEPNIYTITYANTRGVTNLNPVTYTIEDEVIFNPLPYIEGWKFTGWSPASIAKGSIGPKNVTANWERVSNSVTIGGVSTNVSYGTEVIFRAPEPWVDLTNGTQIAYLGTTFTAPIVTNEFALVITNDIDFTWDIQTTNYWLGVDVLGSGIVSPTSGWYLSSSVVPLIATPDVGWYFAGWSGNVSTNSYQAEMSIFMTQPRMVKAVFEKCAHRVEYHIGDGVRIGGGELIQYVNTSGQSLTPPAIKAPTGWIFTGWDKDSISVTNDMDVVAEYRTITPDLHIDTVCTTNIVKSGERLDIGWVIGNTGNSSFRGKMTEKIELVSVADTNDVRVIASPSFEGAVERDGFVERNISLDVPLKGWEGTWYVRIETAVNPSMQEYAANNVTTTTENVEIKAVPLPNLKIGEVSGGANLIPGETTAFLFTITNSGEATASAPWTDRIYLESLDTGKSVKIGDIFSTNNLDFATAIVGEYTLEIPELIPLAGSVRVKAVTDVNDAVVESNDDDNIAYSVGTFSLATNLYLTDVSTSVYENVSGSGVRFTLKRSGPTTEAMTVAVAIAGSATVNCPESVTIPAGSVSTVFYVKPIDNATVEGSRTITISASAGDCRPASLAMTILDNEVPKLIVKLDKTFIREGGGVILATVTRELVTDEPLTVYLAGASTSRCSYPSFVVIPAGEASVTFEISVPNNATAQIAQDLTLRASSSGYTSTAVTYTVEDDDVPGVTLSLTPEVVSEGAGAQAIYATLTRSDTNQIAQAVRVKLTASEANQLILPSEITIPKYTMAVRFAIGVVDNALDDGDREIEINGAIVIESCGCNGQPSNGDVIEALVGIIDNDGPSLVLKANPATMKEGLDPAGYLILSHNSTLTEDLAVCLWVDAENEDEISIPEVVTIPAGETSVRIPVATLDDGEEDGGQLVSVYVEDESNTFAPASTWVQVSDQNLPDLTVAKIETVSSVVAMETFEVSFAVTNVGFMATSRAIPYAVHLVKGANASAVSSATLVKSGTLTGGLEVGEALNGTVTLTAPELPGDYRVAVVIDPDGTISELDSANNTGWSAVIGVTVAYTATAGVDKKVYMPGETVVITGVVSRADGTTAGNVQIDPYVMLSGMRRSLLTTTAADGSYSAVFTPTSGEAGDYSVGACYPGVNSKVAQDSFSIIGMKRSSTANVIWDIALGDSATRTVTIQNRSAVPLTGLTATFTDVPEECGFTYSLPDTIPANGSVTLSMTATADGLTDQVDYRKFYAHLAVDEGLTLDFPLYFHSQAQRAYLRATPTSINTTMAIGHTRYIEVTVVNDGKGDSGAVTVSVPSVNWLRIVSGASIDNLASGESATVTLAVSPTAEDGLTLNSPLSGGRMAVNCANGTGCSVSLKFTPVSEATGSITVDAVDNNTYTLESAPHLSNATVRVSNPYTGVTVATGKTGTDGIWTVDNIPEGTYQLTITAPNHDSYADAITIEPGRIARVEAFLQYKIVNVTWNVEKTEIEDAYDIQLLLDFETQVPAPIVKTTMPTELPDLNEGESYAFTITLENTGVIEAEKVTVKMPSIEGYTFTLSDNDVTVPAKSTVTIAAVFSRPRTRSMLMSSATRGTTVITVTKTKCVYKAKTFVVYPCGKEHPEYSYEVIVRHGTCTTESILEIVIETDDDPDDQDDPGDEPKPRDPKPVPPPIDPKPPKPSPGVGISTHGCDVRIAMADCLKKYKDGLLPESIPERLERQKKFVEALGSDCATRISKFDSQCGVLNDNAKQYGQISRDSYRNQNKPVDVSQTDYRPMTKSEVEQYVKNNGRYKVDENGTITTESGLQATFYVSKDTEVGKAVEEGDITVAFTGTQIDPVDPQDLVADGENYACQYTQQYEDGSNLLSLVVDKTDDSRHIHVTGHSLGGGLTTYAVLNNKKKHSNMTATTYNAAGICSNMIPDMDSCEDASSTIMNYRTVDDWVSIPGFHIGPIVSLCDSKYSGHAAENFGTDDVPEWSIKDRIENAALAGLGLLGEAVNLNVEANGAWYWVSSSSAAHNYYLCVKEHLQDDYVQMKEYVPVVVPKTTLSRSVMKTGQANSDLDDICDSISTGVIPLHLVDSDVAIIGDSLKRLILSDIFYAAQRYIGELCIGTVGDRTIADYTRLCNGVRSDWVDENNAMNYLPRFITLSKSEVAVMLSPLYAALRSDALAKDFSYEDFVSAAPEDYPDDEMRALYNRICPINNPDYIGIDQDKYMKARNILYVLWCHMISQNASSPNDYLAEGMQNIIDYFENESLSVCASVNLQLSQTLAMTREAFDGTLTLYNGNTTTPITNLKLDVSVLDEDGNECKDLFEIFANGTSGDMSEGSALAGGLSVTAGGTGSAMVRFIPERGAAPTEEKLYRFGGTVTYTDPFSGETATVKLTPVALTVSPSPYLHLDYFVQRDVFADDPFTPDVVEASMPAELAVLVRNVGGGNANKVMIASAQPEMVQNEKGLSAAFNLKDYTLEASALNGATAHLGLNTVSLGTIEPNASKVAQWWLTSTIEGHFIGMSATVTPVNSWNTPDAALVDPEVGVHKLVRSIVADGDTLPDFLVCDSSDLYGTPNEIYTARGDQLPVYVAAVSASAALSAGSEIELPISLTPAQFGWNYGYVTIPGLFHYTISRIVRGDGTEIPLRNAWITDRTFRDGNTPLIEDRLHIVDEFASNAAQAYTVYLTAKPSDVPEVASFEGVTDGSIEYAARNAVTVVFSKPINPATFTVDDLMIMKQGTYLNDLSALTITAADDSGTRFTIGNLSALCGGYGRYELTVQCAGIADTVGQLGSVGKSVSWTCATAEAPYVIGADGVPVRRVQSFDSISVTFSAPIKPETFTPAALRLNDVALGSGITISALDASGTRFSVSGLSSTQIVDGEYKLAIDSTAVLGLDNKSGVNIYRVTWIRDTEAPVLQALTREKGLNGNEFILTFSEEVESESLALHGATIKRNGASVALPVSASLRCVANNAPYQWVLSGVDSVLSEDGAYELTFSANGVTDEAGNVASGTKTVSWTVNRTPPAQISDLIVSPDGGFSDTDGVTYTGALTVSGTLPEDGLTVEIIAKYIGGGEIVLMTLPSGGDTVLPAGAFSQNITLPGMGNVTLVVRLTNKAGYTSDTEKSIYVDGIALTGMLTGASEDEGVLTSSAVLTFSDRVIDSDVTVDRFSLTRDGMSIALEGVSLVKETETTFRLLGLDGLCAEDGMYVLRFDGSDIQKYNSGLTMIGSLVMRWRYEHPDREPPMVTEVLFNGEKPHEAYTNVFSSVSVAFSELVNVPELIDNGLIGVAARIDLLDVTGTVTGCVSAVQRDGDVSPYQWNEKANTLSWQINPQTVPAGGARLVVDSTLVKDMADNRLVPMEMQQFMLGAKKYEAVGFMDNAAYSYACPTLYDWNGDGLLDLIVGEKTADNKGKVRIYLNCGTSASPLFDNWTYLYKSGSDVEFTAQGCVGMQVSFGKVGGATMVLAASPGEVYGWNHLEPNTADFVRWFDHSTDSRFSSLIRTQTFCCDVDGDGTEEVLVSGQNSPMFLLKRIGFGENAVTECIPLVDSDGLNLRFPEGQNHTSAVMADMNGDFALDLVTGDSTGNVWVYFGVGNAKFASKPLMVYKNTKTELKRSRLAIGDLNGDGVDDILVGRSDGSIIMLVGSEMPSPIVPFTVKAVVSAFAGIHGAIAPNGDVTYDGGDTPEYTIMPDIGYYIADVQIDGASIGVTNNYVFAPLTTSHTIHVDFAATAYPITYTGLKGVPNLNPVTYTVEDEVVFAPLSDVEGWNFVGWSPKSIAKGSTGPVTVTAQWERVIHSVTVGGASTNVVYGSEMTFRAPEPWYDETCITQIVYLGTTFTAPVVTNEFTVTVTNDIDFTWDILATNYWLQVSASEGGSVDFDGAWMSAGSRKSISATPDFSYRFVRWEGDVSNSQSTSPEIVVLMDQARSLKAVFEKIPLTIGEAANAPEYDWYTEGDAVWFGEWSKAASDGVHAVRSGAIGDSKETVLGLRLEGAGTLSFDWRASCEERYDAIRLEVDGRQIRVLSGETSWTNVCINLDIGEHNIRWIYKKGRSEASGEDAVWVDNVAWTSATEPTLAEALGEFEWETEGDISWVGVRSEYAYEGSSFAISEGLGDYGVSIIRARVLGAGIIKFRWAVSCEESYDWLDFIVDGEVVEMTTGETEWMEVTVELGEGEHVLEWMYWKDEMDDPDLAGANCAMLDYVRWYPFEVAPTGISEKTLAAFFAWLKANNQISQNATKEDVIRVFSSGMTAVGKSATLYSEFVAGTNPADVTSEFKAIIEIDEENQPIITPSPNLGSSRKYVVFGKKNIGDSAEIWKQVEKGKEKDYNFFKITVDLPE